MAHDETNQPKSIEEALNLNTELQSLPDPKASAILLPSTDELIPEPTEEELTQQALAEANSEQVLMSEPREIQPEQRILHFPSPMTIPASNVENQPATQTSIAELPAGKTDQNKSGENQRDRELEALISFIDSHISHRMVNSVIQVICSSPSVSPFPGLWNIPNGFDFSETVTEIVKDHEFLTNIWPHLRIMMGRSFGNVAWTASVAITLAFFEGVKLLPYVRPLCEQQQARK